MFMNNPSCGDEVHLQLRFDDAVANDFAIVVARSLSATQRELVTGRGAVVV